MWRGKGEGSRWGLREALGSLGGWDSMERGKPQEPVPVVLGCMVCFEGLRLPTGVGVKDMIRIRNPVIGASGDP